MHTLRNFLITLVALTAAGVLFAGSFAWVVVPSPNPNEYNVLTGVSAVSANDIWAVGYQDSQDPQYDQFNLAEHWDGKNWAVVSTPSPGLTGCIPYDQKWTIVPSPNATNGSYLYAATAIASNDVWAIGYTSQPGAGKFVQPLVCRVRRHMYAGLEALQEHLHWWGLNDVA